MTSRSELRQRATASTATQESSNNANADPSGKLKVKAVRAADKTYSLAVVIFAALVAFLLGVFFF